MHYEIAHSTRECSIMDILKKNPYFVEQKVVYMYSNDALIILHTAVISVEANRLSDL
jgi:hypothetical protein